MDSENLSSLAFTAKGVREEAEAAEEAEAEEEASEEEGPEVDELDRSAADAAATSLPGSVAQTRLAALTSRRRRYSVRIVTVGFICCSVFEGRSGERFGLLQAAAWASQRSISQPGSNDWPLALRRQSRQSPIRAHTAERARCVVVVLDGRG